MLREHNVQRGCQQVNTMAVFQQKNAIDRFCFSSVNPLVFCEIPDFVDSASLLKSDLGFTLKGLGIKGIKFTIQHRLAQS